MANAHYAAYVILEAGTKAELELLVMKLLQQNSHERWHFLGGVVINVNKNDELTFYQSLINYQASVEHGVDLPIITDADYARIADSTLPPVVTNKRGRRSSSGRSGGNASRTSRKR